ncbi:hypothetical protein [Flammeovirga pacifica]|uniref:Outer membrane protein beta-barrel domain-containing protein n=1 Tax=Flammeovirga pacifica TaxID=915059 RepID=A0A1S1YWV0_FLAPC|nr:hypothetical protein [Flammeovirga pacifica]OHX65500.1 hypothetical protein NH26_03625 [Flammeovirga pacifica]
MKISYSYIILIVSIFFLNSAFGQDLEEDSLQWVNDEVENYNFQTKKGQWVIGMGYGLGVSYQNQNLAFTNSSVLLDVFGSIHSGYFIYDKFWVGGFLHGGLRSVSFNYSNNNLESFFGGGPRIRKYVFNGFFCELSYGKSKSRLSYSVENNVAKFDGYGNIYGLGIGFGNFWTKRFSLDILLNYYYLTTNYDIYETPNTSSNFSITANIVFAGKKE